MRHPEERGEILRGPAAVPPRTRIIPSSSTFDHTACAPCATVTGAWACTLQMGTTAVLRTSRPPGSGSATG